MPLTRSWFSSSVTTSRVCPDETQRRSAVSTSSRVSTVTTAGIGVITCRASCSCRWKTPESIPPSPASRSPPVEDSAISRLSSSGPASSSAICSGRMRSSRRIAFEVALRATMKGRKPIENPCSGRAMPGVRSALTIA